MKKENSLTEGEIVRMESGAGWAERVYPGKLDEVMDTDAHNMAILEHWLLFLPRQHPRWSYYHMTLSHLREDPRLVPMRKGRVEDTHQLILYPQNPDTRPDPGDHTTFQLIGEPSAAAQFNAADDDGDACDTAGMVAEHLVKRELPAEPGQEVGGLEHWIESVRMLAGETQEGAEDDSETS